MGTLVGHVAPGFGFLVIGLWHLINHIKLHSLHPNSYVAPPWFPTPILRHLELILIILASLASISMELIIGPETHQPFDTDGTIPSNHLHNFEHASISVTFLIYASFAIAFDRINLRHRAGMTQLLGAVAFAQQLFLFHLHSADHMGVEGQYHWLLQIVIFLSLATTLIGIWLPRSFMVSFVRSMSIAFQGVWFIVMGFMLWTPSLIPKGCFINSEEGHQVVRCHGDEALHRAKSLVNIQFSWYVAGMAVFSMMLYLFLTERYPEAPEYLPLVKEGGQEDDEDLESQRKLGESESLVNSYGEGDDGHGAGEVSARKGLFLSFSSPSLLSLFSICLFCLLSVNEMERCWWWKYRGFFSWLEPLVVGCIESGVYIWSFSPLITR